MIWTERGQTVRHVAGFAGKWQIHLNGPPPSAGGSPYHDLQPGRGGGEELRQRLRGLNERRGSGSSTANPAAFPWRRSRSLFLTLEIGLPPLGLTLPN
jgi:hypothetical protein